MLCPGGPLSKGCKFDLALLRLAGPGGRCIAVHGLLTSMLRMEWVAIAEILGVLAALHGHAAETAATSASETEIARMQAALDAIQTATTADDIPEALVEFLGTLASAANNALLSVLCRYLTRVQIDLTGELSGRFVSRH